MQQRLRLWLWLRLHPDFPVDETLLAKNTHSKYATFAARGDSNFRAREICCTSRCLSRQMPLQFQLPFNWMQTSSAPLRMPSAHESYWNWKFYAQSGSIGHCRHVGHCSGRQPRYRALASPTLHLDWPGGQAEFLALKWKAVSHLTRLPIISSIRVISHKHFLGDSTTDPKRKVKCLRQ